jgi:hypothetical protein
MQLQRYEEKYIKARITAKMFYFHHIEEYLTGPFSWGYENDSLAQMECSLT